MLGVRLALGAVGGSPTVSSGAELDALLVASRAGGLTAFVEAEEGAAPGLYVGASLVWNGGQPVETGGLLTVEADPRFVDPERDDFSLSDDSPAIDAAQQRDDVSEDYLGVARPQGGAPDLGAFEYASP